MFTGSLTDPADAPVTGASPATALRRYVTKYAVFSGRASRSEYWWVAGIQGVVLLTGFFVWLDLVTSENRWSVPFLLAYLLYGALNVVPTIALNARRLHDTDKSAKNMLWLLFGQGYTYLCDMGASSKPRGSRFDRPL